MNAIAYIRISVVDQSVYSLEYQEKNIRTYCQTHKLNLLDVFRDDGESSYTFDRPDFKRLEQFIKKNKCEYLIVNDHDRFSRNLAEALMKIKELHVKFGIKVLATTDNFNTDFTDPSNFMMRAFKLMIAESELHRIRQRTKAGIVQAKLSGRAVNKAPYGYLNAKDSTGRPTFTIDNDKAVVVRMIYSEFIKGTNIEDIRKKVSEYGYKQKGSSAIQRILTNPLYAALVKVPAYADKPEQIVKAVHPAIINEGQYWLVQTLMNDRTRAAYHTNEEVPLKGVLRCPECGAFLSAGNSKGRNKYYWYYLCATHRKHYSAIKLEQKMGEILDLLSFSDQSLNYFIKGVTDEITSHLKTRGELIAQTQKTLRVVMQKIETIEERWLEGGTSKQTYLKVISKHRAEQEELQRRVYELSLQGEEYFAKLNDLVPKLHDIRGTYEELPLLSKQRLLVLIFGNNLRWDGTQFRTTKLEKFVAHNELILKEKGLLLVEQPSHEIGDNSPTYREGESIRTRFATLFYLCDLLAA